MQYRERILACCAEGLIFWNGSDYCSAETLPVPAPRDNSPISNVESDDEST